MVSQSRYGKRVVVVWWKLCEASSLASGQLNTYHMIERRNGVFIPIFKNGDRSLCNNYRGIAVLSTAGKLLSRIIISRLASLSEDILPEAQCGFRPNRGCADMIFTLRQLQEKSREQN